MMKKGLTFVFAMLLMIGAVAAPSAMADPPASRLLKPTLVCGDGNSDVSLQVRIYNQGPGDIPANSTISYSYKTSANGPVKSGSYKMDGPIPQGQSRTITVS